VQYYLSLFNLHAEIPVDVVIMLKLVDSFVIMPLGSRLLFNNRIIDAWNNLSNEVVKSPSVSIFKNGLHSMNLNRFLTTTD